VPFPSAHFGRRRDPVGRSVPSRVQLRVGRVQTL